MSQLETNVFVIENLHQLSCNYRLYRVRGLDRGQDYHKNMQLLATRLSAKTKSPCVAYSAGDGTFIAQADGYEELPDSFNLVRSPVKIEKDPNLKQLKFDELDETTTTLALRFLQGGIEERFRQISFFWQPRSGAPFYNKSPDPDFRGLSGNVDLHKGFTFRVVPRLGIEWVSVWM